MKQLNLEKNDFVQIEKVLNLSMCCVFVNQQLSDLDEKTTKQSCEGLMSGIDRSKRLVTLDMNLASGSEAIDLNGLLRCIGQSPSAKHLESLKIVLRGKVSMVVEDCLIQIKQLCNLRYLCLVSLFHAQR